MKYILISSWFQIIWFIAVLGQTAWEWLLVVLILVTLIMSFRLSDMPLKKMGMLILLGIGVDQTFIVTGLFEFEGHTFIPIWLIGIWVGFHWYTVFMLPIVNRMSIVNVSILCGIAGALSYFAGMKLGAVNWPQGTTFTLVVLFIEWSVMSYLILKVYQHGTTKQSCFAGRSKVI